MRATPNEQKELLALQRVDLSLSRLAHQVQTHPLREKLFELEERIKDLNRSVLAQDADLAARRRVIKDLEKQQGEVVRRRDLQQRRLDKGQVPMRDMNAVEHEIKRIVERKDELDYSILEESEELEEREGFLEKTVAAKQALEVDRDETTVELEQALVEPNGQIDAANEERNELRETISDALLDEYDYYRTRMGALVVVGYKDGRLLDAPESLTGAEESALRSAPEDELWQSEESGYMVVRL